jgi:DnaJ-class molecular chaperone
MKKINDYRKLFEATPVSTLADLKTTYRNFMKAYHPDKFQDESKSRSGRKKS